LAFLIEPCNVSHVDAARHIVPILKYIDPKQAYSRHRTREYVTPSEMKQLHLGM